MAHAGIVGSLVLAKLVVLRLVALSSYIQPRPNLDCRGSASVTSVDRDEAGV